MKFKVIVADVAEDDLVGVVEYILANSGVERALDVKELILDAIDSLRQNPNRGRVVPALRREGIVTFREVIIKRWHVVHV